MSPAIQTSTKPVPKTRLHPSEFEALAALTGRISATFKTLATAAVDETALKDDFRKLPELLTAFTHDLEMRLHYLGELLKSMETSASAQEFIRQVESQPQQAAGIARELAETRRRIKDTQTLLDGLFKITSKRGILSRVENVPSRKLISHALSEVSVTLDSILDGHKKLEEAVRSVENSGLEKNARLSAAAAAAAADDKAPAAAPAATAALPAAPMPAAAALPPAPQAAAAHPVPHAAHPPAAPLASQHPAPHAVPHAAAHAPAPAAAHPALRGAAPPPANAASHVQEKPAHEKPDRSAAARAQAASKEALPQKEFQRLRAWLTEWSRWHPFSPARLGSGVAILSAVSEPAVKIELQCLWCERTRVKAIQPCRGEDIGRQPVSSLWELPVAPPPEFKDHEESQPIPGEVEIKECLNCVGAGQTVCKKCLGKGGAGCGCEKGHNRCSACQGSGKMLQGNLCRTLYSAQTVSRLDYTGDLPADLLTRVSGEKTFKEVFSALDGGRIKVDLGKKCLESATRHVREYFLHEFLEPALASSGGSAGAQARGASEGGRRLVRASLEITSVPVRHLKCGPRDAASVKGVIPFQAWLYGNEQKLQLSGLPRMWTVRASLWLFGLFALAVPLGYLLAKILP